MRRVSIIIAAMLFAAIGAAGQHAPTYWTLSPAQQPGLEGAKMALVGGHTFPGEYGAHFQLKEVTAAQPVDLQLVSTAGVQLDIIAFKTKPSEPLLEARTGSDRTAKLRFRASGPVYFRITGPLDSPYELAVVVGDAISIPPVDSMVSMKDHGGPRPARIAAAAVAAATTVMAQTDDGGFSATTLLLMLILGALVAIACILLRKTRAIAATTVVVALAAFGSAAGAQMNTFTKKMLENRTLGGRKEYQDRIKPSLIAPPEATSDSQGFINDSKKKWGEISKTRKTFKDTVDWAYALKSFLDKRGLIDPKDAAVQPNYNPRGLPKLPSSYLDELNPGTDKMMKYNALAERVQRARVHLEKNYVARKETELEAGIIREMAEAAAGMSAFAKIAWENAKADKTKGFNVAAARFYAKYDEGQANGIEYLEKALQDMARFEADHYAEYNWYVFYAVPFIQFLRLRYIRPDM